MLLEQQLIATWITQSLKTVTVRAVCVHRSHSFEGLAPGSRYTIKVISASGEKRSKPATVNLHTSTFKMYVMHVCVPTCTCLLERQQKKRI